MQTINNNDVLTNRLIINQFALNTIEKDEYFDLNYVLFPLQKGKSNYESYKATYNWIVDKNKLNKSFSDISEMCLIVEAQSEHKIFNYDEHYNYYIGIDVKNIKLDMTNILTTEEKEIINDIMWRSRNVTQCLREQVKLYLAENIKDDKLELYIDNYKSDIDEYRAVWRSNNCDAGWAVQVSNVNSIGAFIEMFPMGYTVRN